MEKERMNKNKIYQNSHKNQNSHHRQNKMNRTGKKPFPASLPVFVALLCVLMLSPATLSSCIRKTGSNTSGRPEASCNVSGSSGSGMDLSGDSTQTGSGMDSFGSAFSTVSGNPDGGNDPYPIVKKVVEAPDTGDIAVYSMTKDGYFYIKGQENNKTRNLLFFKGVNMGLTLPSTDLNNPDISYAAYYRWFEQIRAMNANTVKVFTIMNPDFYNAFYDYNKTHRNTPLFLLQGIWINEGDMNAIQDAYGENDRILNAYKRTAVEMLDVVHGNSSYTSYGKIQKAVYDKDISPYLAGFILGLEWTPGFISDTNKNHPSRNSYTGQYLYTKNATPFEAFLCNVGDSLIQYQTERYHTQTPVAFLNWTTTDLLTHTNEPFPEEDEVSLNTNHIYPAKTYFPGLFAAIDIYPYYPEFLNYQQEYISWTDPSGKKDPYRAYLRDLKKQYKIPVVVAEFGVPSSRGIAHRSVAGLNQGGVSETQQGEMDLAMMKSIAREGYAGGMVFSWQDEWFKQTWNVIRYAAKTAAKRTQDDQSAEQHYGILAFEVSSPNPVYADGKKEEWTGVTGSVSQNGFSVTPSLREDALYLLCSWDRLSFDPDKDALAVAIGTTNRGSRVATSQKLTFSKPADFLLLLDGKKNTRIRVDSYSDSFYYRYSVQKKVFTPIPGAGTRGTGVFNPVRQFLSNEIILPVSKKTIAPVSYESGLLRYGVTDPENAGYDSLADFYYTKEFAEIRLPWTLLNVMNYVEKARLADFYTKKSMTTETFDSFSIGISKIPASGTAAISMRDVALPDYKTVPYKERLKGSYEILTKGFAGLME